MVQTKKKTVKTMKIRLFPSKEEKVELTKDLLQFKWYYNSLLHLIKNNSLEKTSYIDIRNLLNEYSYYQKEEDKIISQGFNECKSEDMFKPEWWPKVHSRIPRGAAKKLSQNYASAKSNLKNGNTTHFNLKSISKKKNNLYMLFEDKQFPAYIKKIKSRFNYTTKDRKRKNITFQEIFKQSERGLEIIYEKDTKRYYLHYPIEHDWFPADDRRREKQASYDNRETRIVSLDPGIRKFLVGYDPEGYSFFIGEGAGRRLLGMMLLLDLETNKKKQQKLWRKLKNLVNELHWKAISFLISSYDVIILPEFRTSEMLKGKTLQRSVKRQMQMFSFHSFKMKLTEKCQRYGKKLIIVDESYTSCTCGKCGQINHVGSSERYYCKTCKYTQDRDMNGARNIMIKNITLN